MTVKYLFMIFAGVFMNAAAQLLMRYGMLKIGDLNSGSSIAENMLKMFGSFWLWLAVVCYVAAMALWLVVLSKVPVSIAYPFIGLGFVFVAVFAYFIFGERLTVAQIFGIALVCFGLAFIARG